MIYFKLLTCRVASPAVRQEPYDCRLVPATGLCVEKHYLVAVDLVLEETIIIALMIR